jgi:hypothetical protein
MKDKIKYFCYVRPGYAEQFRNIFQSANLEDQTLFISDFKSLSKLEWIYYIKFGQGVSRFSLSAAEIQESIKRCRLLRSMDREEAEGLFLDAFYTLSNIIEEFDIREVFGLCIDSYVGDALRKAINRRGGTYNGIVVSFIQGYFRLTELGESLTNREVTNAEVDSVYQRILENKNRAHFLPREKRSALGRGVGELKGIFKDHLRHQYYRMLKILKIEDNYHVRVNAMGVQGVAPVFNGYEYWKETIDSSHTGLRLYLPLQVSPEATIDYWSQSLAPIDYELFILELVRKLPRVEFIIKENPSIFVRRSKGFYKKLHDFKNVKCVDVNVDSSFLIQHTDATITATGSVGIEAIIQGKPCVLLGNPYYNYSESSFFLSLDVKELDEKVLEEFLKNFYRTDVSTCEKSRIDEQKKIIMFVLSGLLEGDFRLPLRSKNGSWAYDTNAAKRVGEKMASVIGAIS